MTHTGFRRVGRIVKPHGLKGEVAVVPLDDVDLAALVDAEVWFVPPPATERHSRIVAVRSGPKGPLVSLEGVDDIDRAHSLRGSEILARAEDVPEPTPSGELDPIGYRVRDESRGDLGSIVDVIITGANDVWVVHGPLGEVLLPVIDDVIVEVDEAAESVRVTLLPGLLDEEDA